MFSFLKKKIKHILKKVKKDITPELEVSLLEAGVSLEVVDSLIKDIKGKDNVTKALKQSIMSGLKAKKIIIKNKPFVILVAGINGTGKTTSLAKLAHRFLKRKKTVVIAASDTFRAAAIEQLNEHCKKLGIKLIKHNYGADPAAVAFDTIQYAKAKKIDIVIIDTSGRLHSDSGLMRELEKIKKVTKPDLSLLIIDSTTGNDAIEQAKAFNHLIDGFIISKADVDERGGAIISVSKVTGKPIYFLGKGQEYKDLEEFIPEKIIEALDL